MKAASQLLQKVEDVFVFSLSRQNGLIAMSSSSSECVWWKLSGCQKVGETTQEGCVTLHHPAPGPKQELAGGGGLEVVCVA